MIPITDKAPSDHAMRRRRCGFSETTPANSTGMPTIIGKNSAGYLDADRNSAVTVWPQRTKPKKMITRAMERRRLETKENRSVKRFDLVVESTFRLGYSLARASFRSLWRISRHLPPGGLHVAVASIVPLDQSYRPVNCLHELPRHASAVRHPPLFSPPRSLRGVRAGRFSRDVGSSIRTRTGDATRIDSWPG